VRPLLVAVMQDEYIPFLTYRGAVDLKTINVEITSDDDELEDSALFENLQKRKAVRKGKAVKRRRVELVAPILPNTKNNSSVVVVDSDEDLAVSSDSKNGNIVDVLPTTAQNLPGFSAAMNAIRCGVVY
jgi:hypothetical protein